MTNVNPYEPPKEQSTASASDPTSLRLPGIGILVLSVLTILCAVVGIAAEIYIDRVIQKLPVVRNAEDLLFGGWMILMAIVGIAGSRAMLIKKHRRLAVLTAILAVVPYIGIAAGCFASPFGLIALMRLRRKEVWDSFTS